MREERERERMKEKRTKWIVALLKNIFKIEIPAMTGKDFRAQRQIDERGKGIHLVHLQCQSARARSEEAKKFRDGISRRRPRLASLHLTSPRLTTPRHTSPHLSPRLTYHLTSSHLIPSRFAWQRIVSPRVGIICAVREIYEASNVCALRQDTAGGGGELV